MRTIMKLFALTSAATVSFAARINRQQFSARMNQVEGSQDASVATILGLVGADMNITDPNMDHNCQSLWPEELNGEFTDVKAVGVGATACVYLGKDNTNTLVQSKWARVARTKKSGSIHGSRSVRLCRTCE